MKTVRKVCQLTAIGVIAVASIVALAASSTTGSAKGSVTRLGIPVVGAKVAIESGNDSAYGAIAYTDMEGAFSFSEVPVGEVSVKAYDAQDALLASAKGVLAGKGEVLTLQLEVQ